MKVKPLKKRNMDATMPFVIKTARTYDPDAAHSEHVMVLGLSLFDGLQSLHGYGADERRPLEIAGRLHDIGWSKAFSGKHHKLSRDRS
jgi:exopolyphosphatase/guanosine-5'-triphosphate,3'-diphosphate pyrophosphatase